MKRQKILIISSSFYPMNTPRSFRTTELLKEFCRQGHDVTIYTFYDSNKHDKLAKEFGFTIKNIGKLKFPRLPVNKKGILGLFLRILKRSLLMLFEYPGIELMYKVRNILKHENDYDMLVTIAVPHTIHWGTALARTKKHHIATTWIADCGDPYMFNRSDSFNKLFYFKYFEKAFCRKANYITVPLENAKEAYYPEFRSKIVVIPQGFKFEDTKKLLHPYRHNSVPTFAYAGAFIENQRDPRPIIKHLLSTGLNFKFYIYTKKLDLIRDLVKEADGKIITSDYIPREELIPILGSMDFLMNIENAVPEQLPSKIIDYGLTGRPILSVNSNSLDKEILFQFLNGDYSQALDVSELEKYNIERVSQQFLDLSSSNE